MPITTDYDTFATRYHGSSAWQVEISHSEDTPDEFFDALDEFFGTDDGYTHHLSRIYAMKDKIASLQASEAKLEAENEKLKEENKKLAEIDHQLYSVRRDADICEITGLEDISELEDFVAELKDASTGDEIEELKAETDRLGKWKIYYEDLVGFGRIEHYEEKRKEYDPDFVPLED